ncbi:cationic amino acid transporter 4-like [Asterias rubens]|uniref:cationic amino acid transporter 4-like n=1 Tax=Asterias rubens TaxID=7604 RepID=UPI0014551594|nr:cationic amino acid transporter 4-like [Asterias rubens]
MALGDVVNSLSLTKTSDVTSAKSQFLRCLTTKDLTIIGIGSMMGTGLYVLTGVVAKETAGPAVIISYLIAAVVSMMAAMCYAEFGSRVPITGSAYTYTYITIGELWAFLIGWNLILEYVVGGAAVARSWSGYFDELVGYKLSNFTKNVIFGGNPLEVPYLAEFPDFFSGLLVVLVLIPVALGANVSVKSINVMAVINVGVVVFVFVAGLIIGDFDNWNNFFPFGFSGAVAGASSCFFAFSGFDVISLSSEEALDPARSIPRATGLSVIIAGLCYVAVSVSLTIMVPYNEISDNSSFAHAFATHGLLWAKYIVGLGALCGMLTSLLGSLFSIPRSVYAMANDGLLFASLAKVSKRTQVPVVATFIFGAICAVMASIFDLSSLVEFMSIGVLMAYSIVCGAVIVLRYRPDMEFSHFGVESILDDTDEEEEELMSGDVTNRDHEDQVFINRDGRLKQQFEFLTFLDSSHPGRVVSVCLLLTIIFQTAAVVVAMATQDNIKKGEWWAVTMVTVLAIVAVVVFLPIPLHNQARYDGRTYRVPFVPYLPIMSILCDVILMVMLQPITWVRFAIWVGIGMLLYVFYGYHHSVERLKRRTSKTKDEYQVLAAGNDVTASLPLNYESIVHEQQPKSSTNSSKTETLVD